MTYGLSIQDLDTPRETELSLKLCKRGSALSIGKLASLPGTHLTMAGHVKKL